MKQYVKYSALLVICALWGGACQNDQSNKKTESVEGVKHFPQQMVGTWFYQYSPQDEDQWQFTFAEDGTITHIQHNVFGHINVEDGGVYKEGPDAGTFLICTLGPVLTEYDAQSDKIKVSVTVDHYEMKFVEGTLKGHILDTFIGSPSEDGNMWEVEWRSYGWLEGAADPPIDTIDANPNIVKFQNIKNFQ